MYEDEMDSDDSFDHIEEQLLNNQSKKLQNNYLNQHQIESQKQMQ